jgi:inner membrane protein
MANAKQHALIGASVGAVGWLLYCKLLDRPIEVGELLLAAGVGMIGGLLPDLLEPAIHPNHRRFFHSYAATPLLAQANRHVSQSTQMPAETRAAIHLISLGFFSHLAADAHTPKGLPWV